MQEAFIVLIPADASLTDGVDASFDRHGMMPILSGGGGVVNALHNNKGGKKVSLSMQIGGIYGGRIKINKNIRYIIQYIMQEI